MKTMIAKCRSLLVVFSLFLGLPALAISPPANFSAQAGNQSVTLKWTASAGVTSYNLEEAYGTGTRWTHIADPLATATSYVRTNRPNGVTYSYRINAVGGGSTSVWSNTVSATPSATATPTPTPPPTPTLVSYTSFDGANLNLYAWTGNRISVLSGSASLDSSTMSRLVSALDAGCGYYGTVTGRTPSLAKNINGKATIAEVPSTCGAGCGYLGSTGIEIQTDYFGTLYTQVRDSNLYDQVPFYEMGRNFWFYEDKIEYKGTDKTGTIATGYAVYMRFKAMESAGVQGAPYNGASFGSFKNEVATLVDRYEADTSLDWYNTLRVGQAPANSMNLGGTDLFASFCMRLERDYGGNAFVDKLWKEVDKQPNATTTTDALNNFVRAASTAAGQDLTLLFRNRWRWPV